MPFEFVDSNVTRLAGRTSALKIENFKDYKEKVNRVPFYRTGELGEFVVYTICV